ncbi:MAG: FAD-dependent oxidoreductase, partial [Candidatus Competibacteraceae bacterium]|nr:FAD-dependent oxidoreductase [Candidatus Competibacteraceae bacterium]
MNENQYDVIVIGTGPGGEGAAMNVAKAGKRVVVVERNDRVGGGCTHWGTIPSKALRQAIGQLLEFNRNPLVRRSGDFIRPSFPDLLRTAEAVINQQVMMRQDAYDRNRISVLHGHARFLDTHTLEIQPTDGRAVTRLEAASFVIATGSRPYRPEDVDFTHPRIFDSDTILSMTATPRSVTIYGAGVIGCEYASIFGSMGCKVDLINTRSQLLSFLDDEIAHALSYHLRDQGVIIRNNESYEAVEGNA